MFELSVFLRDRLIGRSVFSDDEVRIGRSADNEVQIDNLALSRYHASIENVNGAYVLKDWQSQNGTFVNGDRVPGRRALDDGDRIGFGKFVLVFRTDKSGASQPAKIRDKASYAVAGETVVGNVAPEVRARPCPHAGHLEQEGDPSKPPVPIPLDRDVTLVGAAASCHVTVPAGAGAPDQAAAILRGWTGYSLVPFGQGVRLKGEAVVAPATLASGDEVRVGSAVYRFRVTRLEVGP